MEENPKSGEGYIENGSAQTAAKAQKQTKHG